MKHKHKWVKPPDRFWFCTKTVRGQACHERATRACLDDGCLDDGRCVEHAPKLPVPHRARQEKRWATGAASFGFRWIKFDGTIVPESTVAHLLNAAGIVPGKKTP